MHPARLEEGKVILLAGIRGMLRRATGEPQPELDPFNTPLWAVYTCLQCGKAWAGLMIFNPVKHFAGDHQADMEISLYGISYKTAREIATEPEVLGIWADSDDKFEAKEVDEIINTFIREQDARFQVQAGTWQGSDRGPKISEKELQGIRTFPLVHISLGDSLENNQGPCEAIVVGGCCMAAGSWRTDFRRYLCDKHYKELMS
jgi:hypothetical protein